MRMRAALVLVTVLSAAPALAGTIDTRPKNFVGGAVNSTQPIGQTFVADDRNLSSFSFEAGPSATTSLIGEIWATSGGVPTGTALWVSAPQAVPVAGHYVFGPNFALVPGTTYAIVARASNAVANVPLGIVTGNPYAGGTAVVSLDGASATWQTFPSVFFVADLSTRIVMNPEPGTLALFAAGAVGLGVALRRRRAAARKSA